MSEFMRGPFIVVTVVTMACTILTVVVPATLPLFSLQSERTSCSAARCRS